MRYTRAQIVNGTGFEPGALFEQVENYNGWTNRETWAVALWINNEQGMQESVHESLRQNIEDLPEGAEMTDYLAGEIVQGYIEDLFDTENYGGSLPGSLVNMLTDIGSLYRVNWDEIGASFLSDIAEG